MRLLITIPVCLDKAAISRVRRSTIARAFDPSPNLEELAICCNGRTRTGV